MKEIKDTFISALENYPLQSGFILIGLGIILLFFRLEKKNTFRMRDYESEEWSMLLSTWTLIFIIVLTGIMLIFKSI